MRILIQDSGCLPRFRCCGIVPDCLRRRIPMERAERVARLEQDGPPGHPPGSIGHVKREQAHGQVALQHAPEIKCESCDAALLCPWVGEKHVMNQKKGWVHLAQQVERRQLDIALHPQLWHGAGLKQASGMELDADPQVQATE